MKYQLYEGDCLAIMPTLPEKSIDLGIVDPPYNIGKAEWDKFPSHEAYIEFMGRLFLEYQRVLKDNGSFYWFHSEMPVIAELMRWIEDNTDFVFKQFIVWNKRYESSERKFYFDNVIRCEQDRNYRKMAEYCLFYTFQDETGLSMIHADRQCFASIKKYLDDELDKTDYTQQTIKDVLKNEMASHYFGFSKRDKSQFALPTEEQYKKLQSTGFFSREYEDLRREYEDLRREYEDLRYTFNNQKTHHSVWNYEIAKSNGHATPKPVELIKNIIRHSSNEGDTILDACAGSGTTGQAALELNRVPVLIEQKRENCEKIAERLSTIQRGLF